MTSGNVGNPSRETQVKQQMPNRPSDEEVKVVISILKATSIIAPSRSSRDMAALGLRELLELRGLLIIPQAVARAFAVLQPMQPVDNQLYWTTKSMLTDWVGKAAKVLGKEPT